MDTSVRDWENPVQRKWRTGQPKQLVSASAILMLVAGLLAFGVSTPASAAANEVLILGSTVAGGSSSIEASEVTAKGLTPVVVDDATWQGMNQTQFSAYRALILGDASCSSTVPAAAESTVGVWGPAVTGNVLIAGTDPVFHASQGGDAVTRRAVDFVVDQAGKTGAYIALSCYYESAPAKTPVRLLDSLRPGGFTVTGASCYNTVHIVATHPALTGLTDSQLSNWSCSVHEAFDTWPADFTVLTIAKDFGAAYTASDGTIGTPYMLARGSGLRSFPLSLDPVTQTRAVNTVATATAQLLDGATSAPVAGTQLSAKISAGPNAGAVLVCGICTTDAAGHVQFTYFGRSGLGTDTLQVWIDTDANGAPSAGEPQTTAAIIWTSEPSSASYVALGDSFSSGEGNGPYQPDSNNAQTFDTCHRSDDAYGPLLSTARNLSQMIFKACSGAVTNDLFAVNHDNINEPDQTTWLTDQTKMVTLTIGGNDLDFPKVMEHCVSVGVADPWPYINGFGCSNDKNLRTNMATRMNALAGKADADALFVRKPIHSELSVIERIHAKANNAKIYIAGYPLFFGPSSTDYVRDKQAPSGQACVVGHIDVPFLLLKVDRLDALWMDIQVNKINAVIQQAVLDAKAKGIDVTYVKPAFGGHGLCDLKASYLNGVIYNGVLFHGGSVDPGSFHPTALGQQDGYFSAFNKAVK